MTYPAFHAILGRWVPAHERTKLSTFAYAGAYAGTVASNPISGYVQVPVPQLGALWQLSGIIAQPAERVCVQRERERGG